MQSPADDALTHAELGAAAAGAMQEGQFPIREVPRLNHHRVERDPSFQFYAVLPYTVAGLFGLAGLDPHHALVLAVVVTFLVGYLGTFLLCAEVGAEPTGATLGAAIFTLAPYHLTDWFGRAAFPELVSFGVLPWTFWASWRLARRFDALRVALAGIAWAALVLSHNIFHVWTVPLLGALITWEAWVGEQRDLRPWNIVPGYLLGLGLSLFFFAGPLLLGSSLAVAGTATPFSDAIFSTLPIVLSPVWARVPEAVLSPNIGLQIGWPCLAGLVAFVAGRRVASLRSGFALLFLITLFMVWSPVDFWRYLGPFTVIQFPYRLLAYGTLFGSVLAAVSFGRLEHRRGAVLLASVVALALWALDWKAVAPSMSLDQLERGFRARGATMRNGLAYMMTPEARRSRYPDDDLLRGRPANVHPGPGKLFYGAFDEPHVAFGPSRSGVTSSVQVWSERPAFVVLDRTWYPGVLDVRVNGAPARHGYFDGLLAVEIPPGTSVVEHQFRGWWWANLVSAASAVATAALLLWSLAPVRRLAVALVDRLRRRPAAA
jgi:hypothetical protein